MDGFKVPFDLPQDLLLIQELVGHSPEPQRSPPAETGPSSVNDDCIDSSDSGSIASEDEIAADLVEIGETASIELNQVSTTDSDDGSDSSSDSEAEVAADGDASVGIMLQDQCGIGGEDDEEDSSSPNVASRIYFQTKNEVAITEISIPDVQTIGPEEELEKIGEILNIVDDVAIVKGTSSGVNDKALDKALDSDTLLVFGDRTVMGYICETFGPTSQPLYQVRFNQKYPLDPEKVRPSREVFHVPQRSKYVFLNQLKLAKGSDASNVHDEEPGEDELEFSDDEDEVAHRHRRKRQGGSRSGSVTSSRFSTPLPSQARDQDMNDYSFIGANPYDEHGPYDMDLSASIRPPPMPYDDPYSDAYLSGASTVPEASSSQNARTVEKGQGSNYGQETKMRRGRGRGRGDVRRGGRSMPTSGLRGWGRGRGPRDRGRGTVPDSEMRPIPSNGHAPGWATQSEVGRLISQLAESRDSQRPPSPLSMTTATGQSFSGTEFGPSASPVTSAGNGWTFEQSQQYPMQIDPRWYQYQYVQPHINPRFASAFGLNVMGMTQPQTYEPAGSSVGYQSEDYNSTQHNTVDEWTVYAAQGDGPNAEHREGG